LFGPRPAFSGLVLKADPDKVVLGAVVDENLRHRGTLGGLYRDRRIELQDHRAILFQIREKIRVMDDTIHMQMSAVHTGTNRIT
jgi:hypothetical protein